MDFLTFKTRMFSLACFTTDQVYAWKVGFDRNNLTRWTKKGYLIRLRQGYFTFPEYKDQKDYYFYFANRIYKPSYISLQTALAFYGMIPEAVVQMTGVTTLKTASFSNDFGDFSYHNLQERLMFGYELRPIGNDRTIQLAMPEKAVLDLLYLYPFYNTQEEMAGLRLDEDYMHHELNKELLMDYGQRFQNKAFDRRLKLLLKSYDI